MKRLLHQWTWAAVLLATLVLVSSCEGLMPNQEVLPTSVSLQPDHLNLVVGDEQNLTATVLPEDASNKEVTWESSNPQVATVTDGKVVAVAAGTAQITVRTVKGDKSATCAVEVQPRTIPVTGVTLNPHELTLVVGEEAILTAAIEPTEATNQGVLWQMSDQSIVSLQVESNAEGIASASSPCTITALAPGTVTVAVQTVEHAKVAECHITVKPRELATWDLNWELLPPMTRPRQGHHLFFANNEIVVVGGHTTGFALTATAERFSNGAWVEMKTKYPHDGGGIFPLSNGDVVIAGGHGSGGGSGHSAATEVYVAERKEFMSTIPSLPLPASFFSVTPAEDKQYFFSGNWYSRDHISRYTEGGNFERIKNPTRDRTHPHVVRTAPGNAMIFGRYSTEGRLLSGDIVIDRVKGEPFTEPLLNEYELPTRWEEGGCNAYIADYEYLFPVYDPKKGTMVILKTEGEKFSKLSLSDEISTVNRLNGEKIEFRPELFINRDRKEAYMLGATAKKHKDRTLYLVKIHYVPDKKGICKVSMGISQKLLPGNSISGRIMLLPDGRIIMTGGNYPTNFTLSSEVCVITIP